MISLEEIKKALEGVTPGPWYEGDKWVYSHPRSGVSTDGLENVLTNAEAQKNARYIAAANPAAISELISTIESLQAKNEGLLKRAATAEKRLRGANAAFERERKLHLENQDLNRKLETRAETAEAEVARLREALKPFAEIDPINVYESEDEDANGRYILTENQFRLARKTLASTGGEHHAGQ